MTFWGKSQVCVGVKKNERRILIFILNNSKFSYYLKNALKLSLRWWFLKPLIWAFVNSYHNARQSKRCLLYRFRSGLAAKISLDQIYVYSPIEASLYFKYEGKKESFARTFKREGPNLISVGPGGLVHTRDYIFTNTKESFTELIQSTYTALLQSDIWEMLRKPIKESAALEQYLKEEI